MIAKLKENYWGCRIIALLLVATLLVTALSSTLMVQAYADVIPAASITVKDMTVRIDGELVYDYKDGVGNVIVPNVTLNSDSRLFFALNWAVSDDHSGYFNSGDQFSLNILETPNLSITGWNTQEMLIETTAHDGGESTTSESVATGKFNYNGSLLSMDVKFNDKVNGKRVLKGQASGGATFSLGESGAKGDLVFNTNDKGQFTYVPPEKVITEIPGYIDHLPDFSKGIFAPETSGGEISASGTYPVVKKNSSEPDRERHGLDWRLTFLDMAKGLQRKDPDPASQTDYLVIRDTISSNQEFANFEYTKGNRDYGFAIDGGNTGRAYPREPFYLEIPIVAYNRDRFFNYEGTGNPTASNASGYFSTIIRGSEFKEVTSNVESTVASSPMTWGIYTDDKGKDTLIVNVGKLATYDEGINGTDINNISSKSGYSTPEDILDQIVTETLSAHDQGHTGAADKQATWREVFENDMMTIFTYWPELRADIVSMIGPKDINSSQDSELIKYMYETSTYTQVSNALKSLSGTDVGHMRIFGFVLRYRTIIEELTAPYDITNDAKITSSIFNKGTDAVYSHWYRMNIDVELDKQDIYLIKVDAADGNKTGKYGLDDVQNLAGLEGAEFEVTKKGSDTKLRFERTGTIDDTDVRPEYKLVSSGGSTTISPGKNGLIIRKMPYDTYIVKETKAPTGYYNEPNHTIEVTIESKANDAQYLVYANTIRSVRFRKVDNTVTPPIYLKDAKFALYTQKDVQITNFTYNAKENYYMAGSGNDELITHEDGWLEVRGLEDGGYYFIETEAPPGYTDVNGGKKINFILSADHPTNNEKGIIELSNVGNVPLDSLKVKKEKWNDSTGKYEDFADVTFTLTGSGGYEQKVVTNSEGIAGFTLPKAGEYTLKETTPDGGYEKIPTIQFTVDSKGKISKWSPQDSKYIDFDDVTFTFHVKNHKPNEGPDTKKLHIYKKDSRNDKNLSGATFRLTYPDGTSSTKMTGSDGHIWFNLKENPKSSEEYTLYEVKAPEGYKLISPNPIYFSVDANYKITMKQSYSFATTKDVSDGIAITLKNTPEDPTSQVDPKTFTVIKRDSSNDKPLKGSDFKLTRPDGTVISSSGTTGTDGKLTFKLPETWSTSEYFKLEEIQRPSGYQSISTIYFTMDASGNIKLRENYSFVTVSGTRFELIVKNTPNKPGESSNPSNPDPSPSQPSNPDRPSSSRPDRPSNGTDRPDTDRSRDTDRDIPDTSIPLADTPYPPLTDANAVEIPDQPTPLGPASPGTGINTNAMGAAIFLSLVSGAAVTLSLRKKKSTRKSKKRD